jgi:IS1 family transposase
MKGEPGVGDVWTWTAMDADAKLVISWLVGERDAGYAAEFIDLAGRLATRVQLTTDGLKVYLEAIDGAFGADVDYAQLVEALWRGARTREAIQPRTMHRLSKDTHGGPS